MEAVVNEDLTPAPEYIMDWLYRWWASTGKRVISFAQSENIAIAMLAQEYGFVIVKDMPHSELEEFPKISCSLTEKGIETLTIMRIWKDC